MNLKVSHLILIAVVLIGLCAADTNHKGEPATACEAHAVMGQTADITCHFGRDVRATKHSVDVQFYPGDSNEPVSVLTCNWLVKRPNEPTCTASKECHYNTDFGDTLKINITNATKGNEGRYICQLVPSDGIPAQPCRLTVTDNPSPPEDLVADGNSTVAPSPGKPDENRTQVNVPAVVLGIMTFVLSVCVLSLAMMVRRLQKKSNNEEKNVASSSPFLPPC